MTPDRDPLPVISPAVLAEVIVVMVFLILLAVRAGAIAEWMGQ